MQDRPRDNRYSPQNSRSYFVNSHNHQIDHTQTETGHLASTDNPEEIIRRQEIKAQDNTDQIIE